MSTEENKAIARRLVEEIQNQRNINAMDELYAADYVNYTPQGVPLSLTLFRSVKRNTSHAGVW
jgi:hypothetical protein